MSVASGLNSTEGETMWRRCVSNVVVALRLLARPPRRQSSILWPTAPRDLAVAAAAAVGVVLILMITPDAATIRGVGQVPRWITSVFHDITDYGKSGWFLWPVGLLFLALCATPPVLTPVSQRVLAAIMVRIGFLFAAIAVPSLFATIVKRFIGRARPGVGGSIDPFLFDPFA